MLHTLPPEIISNIYALLAPSPPPPPSRHFVPYFRQSLFHSLEIFTFAQLDRLSHLFLTTLGIAECVKEVEIGLIDSTEELLEKFEKNPGILRELLDRFEGLRELKCRDWMSTSLGLLSQSGGTGGPILGKLNKLTISVLLTQLNQPDFTLHRLSILSRYPSLRTLEVVVQPVDPSSSTTNAFDLFPSITPFSTSSYELDGFPPASIHQIRELSLVGPLCDRRLQSILALFENVQNLSLLDLFSSSQNLSPLLATLRTPQELVSLKLSQLYSTSMPINLPPSPNISFSPLTSLQTLEVNVPLPSLSAQDLFLPSLSHLVFSTNSTPSFEMIHELLLSNPPSLSKLTLSHISGSVGSPLSRQTYPLVLSWLSALLSDDPESRTRAGEFPLSGWEIPVWPSEFDPNLSEILFPLAASKRVGLDGSLISAMLTAYVLDKQLESWKELLEAEERGEDGGKEERDEMEAVFGDRRFWDALALRYRARLGLEVPMNDEDGEERTRMGELVFGL
ncbi:hypothetical protein JCM5353_008339 [Sporobolomyces roseus]